MPGADASRGGNDDTSNPDQGRGGVVTREFGWGCGSCAGRFIRATKRRFGAGFVHGSGAGNDATEQVTQPVEERQRNEDTKACGEHLGVTMFLVALVVQIDLDA